VSGTECHLCLGPLKTRPRTPRRAALTFEAACVLSRSYGASLVVRRTDASFDAGVRPNGYFQLLSRKKLTI
jgi:hypothetical protein